jgi:hypothetical protein
VWLSFRNTQADSLIILIYFEYANAPSGGGEKSVWLLCLFTALTVCRDGRLAGEIVITTASASSSPVFFLYISAMQMKLNYQNE